MAIVYPGSNGYGYIAGYAPARGDYLFYGGPWHNTIRLASGNRSEGFVTQKLNRKFIAAQITSASAVNPAALAYKVVKHEYRLEKIQDLPRDLYAYVYVYQGDRPYHTYKIANLARRRGVMRPGV
jgi:hypothetical protein